MKIDVTKIDGYESMSAEEKLKALEEFDVDVPEPDYTGYVKKEVFDKTASELAEKKKELRDKLSTDEAEKLKEKEERDKLQADYEKLLHETAVAKNKSNLLALGYDEKLADETAEAAFRPAPPGRRRRQSSRAWRHTPPDRPAPRRNAAPPRIAHARNGDSCQRASRQNPRCNLCRAIQEFDYEKD